MKRYLILTYFLIFGLSLGFAQTGKIIDDIYVTPNDAQMVNEIKAAERAKERKETEQSAVYRNGAREIVFIDQYGNKTTAVSDTVYIVDNEVYADSDTKDEGYYINGFSGSQSDLEYAERIRRFHNPRYTITIADPGYNDIYFLDNNYWNVYVDGMYATITPTWTNPYSWNYQWAPYSYSSWAWRHNWGYPSWGSYYGLYDPWYSGYGWGGWHNPWYSGYYGMGGYYGYGYGYGYGSPYYGGHYGWGGYPYYGGYYGYSNYNSNYDQANRRSISSDRYTASGLRSNDTRRSAVMSGNRATTRSNDFTRVATDRSNALSTRSSISRDNTSRTTGRTSVSGIDTRTRTGAVRSTDAWNNTRNSRDYSTGSRSANDRSTIINRSSPSTRSSSVSGSADTRRNSSTYTPARTSTSRSSDTSRGSTYSSPTRSSSSSGSYSGGGSSSGGSSSSSTGSGSRR